MFKFSIAIHGGAGTILESDCTPKLYKLYTDGLSEALNAGYAILEKGGKALDAVIETVRELEDNILFNAGRGSVFSNSGRVEMDAALMDGSNLKAGAVAGISNIKNPIRLAYTVMNATEHVFLVGRDCLDLALQHGIAIEPDEYFHSDLRYKQWKAVRDTDSFYLDHSSEDTLQHGNNKKFGTVGAVACDAAGNVAAATSTGGMTNKKLGRIGDTPIIGAGTYANNSTCAISCTGHGEKFILSVAAYDVSCLMEYKRLSLEEAMKVVVNEKLVKIEGEGGMVGVDNKGNYGLVFNSIGMYRAAKTSDGEEIIKIFK